MKKLCASAIFLLFGACSTLPHFQDGIHGKRPAIPTVNDVTHEVQCELLGALKKGQQYASEKDDQRAKDPANMPFLALAKFAWAVNVNLTLDVTDDEGLNPSLSYIDPLKAADTNFTATLSAQLSEEQHRNLTVQFTLLLDGLTDASHACEPNARGLSGLRGDLGLGEIITTGLPYAVGQPESGYVDTPYIMNAIGIGAGAGSGTPVFGSQIDFSLVYGMGGTPTWTLTHFTGPGSTSASLLTAMRTHKDTLVLSFAQSTGGGPGNSNAAKAAQDNSTRMILQHLIH